MIKEMTVPFAPWDGLSARVYGAWKAYGSGAQCWVQDDGAALLSLVEGIAVLAAKPEAAWEELRCFLQLLPWGKLLCGEEAARQLGFPVEGASVMLRFDALKQKAPLTAPCVVNPAPGLVYDLLTACGFPGLGSRNDWMADMVLRWRKGTAKTWVLGGCCTASALAIAPGHVFLGALGTLPQQRGQGLARQLLGHLYEQFPGETLWLSCRAALLGFYESIGFTAAGQMVTLQKEGQ